MIKWCQISFSTCISHIRHIPWELPWPKTSWENSLFLLVVSHSIWFNYTYIYIYIYILTLYAFQKMSCIYLKLKDIHKIVIFRLFTNLLQTLITIYWFIQNKLALKTIQDFSPSFGSAVIKKNSLATSLISNSFSY